MKILIVGKFYTEGFALHISETLQKMGHQPIQCDVNGEGSFIKKMEPIKKYTNALYGIYKQTPAYQSNFSNRIKKILETNNVELTIVCHDFLIPEQVNMIKEKTKAPVVLWFPDHVGRIGKSIFLNADYSFLFFKDPFMVQRIRREVQHRTTYYLPECANVNRHKPQDTMSTDDLDKYGCDLTTAGNLHTNRIEFFKLLSSFDCKIWGNTAPKWADIGGIEKFVMNEFVANEEKSKAFSAAKIVLNNLYFSEIDGVNVRTFEVAAIQAFQLVNWRPGLNQLYRIDEEIVSFKTINELQEKIEYYLLCENEREQIAQKAYSRTLAEHTYTHRLTTMMNTVFGNESGFPIILDKRCS